MEKVLMVSTVASTIGQFNMNNISILKDMGYEVHVACNFRDTSVWPRERVIELIRQLKLENVRYHQIDFSRSPKDVCRIYKSFTQVDTLLNKYDFKFVHCHTPFASAITRVACHRHKVKVMYTAHGFHFYDGAPLKNWLIYYPVEKFLSKYTDVLITINREDYKRAKRYFKARKVVYVPGVGVDIEKFAPGLYEGNKKNVQSQNKRKEIGIPDDAMLLISIGELSVRKNHKVVIETINKMDDLNIYYLIVGEGELKTELQKMIRLKGLENRIKLLGFRNDVQELLECADIFVFPSIQEGLPVALMEAMASGLPCIVSDIRGNSDLILDEKYKAKPQIPEMWIHSIKMLFADNSRGIASKKNRKRINFFGINNVNKRMRQIYQKGC